MKYTEDYINKIICGDCLEVMKGIPDKAVGMILCDLPYGTTECKWDTVIAFEPLWNEYNRICKGAIALTASQPFTSACRTDPRLRAPACRRRGKRPPARAARRCRAGSAP